MLLSSDIVVMVYRVNNDTFEEYGVVNQFTSFVWPEQYIGYGDFTLWAPITEENNDLLQEGHIIWCGDEKAGIIDNIQKECTETGELNYTVTGKTLEVLLKSRTVLNTFYADNEFASSVMRGIVNANCIMPTDMKRKIPWLTIEETELTSSRMSTQITGGEVYEALEEIANEQGLGFSVKFDPKNKRLLFSAYSGVDRSVSQDVNDPVILTTDLEDILKSLYTFSSQDYKNVAVVDGEGEGSDRKRVMSGNTTLVGFDRYEMYVDARDVQKQYTDDDGSQHTMTDSQYEAALIQRGNEKLAEQTKYESLEATIRVDDRTQYTLGVDFFCGDIVTVVDERLLCAVDARVTAIEEDVSDKYELVITFGYSTPTLMSRIRKSTK